MKRPLNWHPARPDFRAKKFSMLREPLKVPSAAQVVDLRSLDSPVFDQGEIGSCTANAWAGAFEFLELQELRAKQPGVEIFPDGGFDFVSRLFAYYAERQIDGDVYQDGGSTLTTGAQVIRELGLCRESLWPYDAKQLYVRPSPAAYIEAAKHREIHSFQLDDIYDMFNCLGAGFPFVLGITVFESFMSVGADGTVPMPAASEQCEGGHAVMCVGYDNVRKVLTIKNSWGNAWGDKGYFYLPFSYVENQGYASDFWTLRRQ